MVYSKISWWSCKPFIGYRCYCSTVEPQTPVATLAVAILNVTGFEKTLRMGSARDSRNARF